MEQWKGRVAVVTGGSSGIGAVVAKDLVKAGMITIGLARRVEEIEALKKDLPASLQSNLHAYSCDITKEDEIVKVFSAIDAKFNGVDVLINNAGTKYDMDLIKGDNSAKIRQVIDTNVLGLVFSTREAYKSMEKHGRNSHVVHINSIAGHRMTRPLSLPSPNIYAPSKWAVTAITEIHRQEFIRSKHHIKVTSVSPGAVNTHLLPKHYKESNIPMLKPEDVSNSILHVLGTPPHVQIHELTIKPFREYV
uniref:Putative dehydrogenase n=1 Tax=Lutzomyia longipalpis TaxID=7200 RepID=A0A7G3AUM4_LUTLO